MLRRIACQLLARPEPRLAIQFISICMLRYPFCQKTLQSYIDKQLDALGAEPLPADRPPAPQQLIDAVAEKLAETTPPRSSRDLAQARRLAEHIVYTAVLALADALGIEC